MASKFGARVALNTTSTLSKKISRTSYRPVKLKFAAIRLCLLSAVVGTLNVTVTVAQAQTAASAAAPVAGGAAISAPAAAPGAPPAAGAAAIPPPNAVPAPGPGGVPAGGQPAKTAGSLSEAETLFAGLMDPFEYDPRGRKDPFVMPIPEKAMSPGAPHGPILPLQAFNLDQLRLVGIIWDVRHPKAMIKDPDGKTHIVGPNTKVGPKNGYIAVIREGEMVVVETTEQMGKLVSTAQVVKIAK